MGVGGGDVGVVFILPMHFRGDFLEKRGHCNTSNCFKKPGKLKLMSKYPDPACGRTRFIMTKFVEIL
jgi:hypothetical protein